MGKFICTGFSGSKDPKQQAFERNQGRHAPWGHGRVAWWLTQVAAQGEFVEEMLKKHWRASRLPPKEGGFLKGRALV